MNQANPMHVVINTLSVTPDKGGIKTYLLSLVRALLAVDQRSRYTLLCASVNRELFEPIAEGAANASINTLRLRTPNASARIWYDQFVVPGCLGRLDATVLLTPSNIASLRARLPQVVVVQAPLAVRSVRRSWPEGETFIPLSHRLYFDVLLPISLRRAAHVVAVSEHLHDKLIESYPESRAKLRIVHEGVDVAAFEARADGEPSQSGPPYVLFVSTLFPYKNAGRLLRAFARARVGGTLPTACRLKLAGRDPDGRQIYVLRRLCDELGIADATEFLGAVPHGDVADLYRNAALFVYPSAMETFGLPILEAMSCGAPIVASNRMSVPEVVGDAGLIVDPDNVAALSQAIGRVLADANLRRELRERGYRRVKEFTWSRAAKGTLNVLREAAATGVLGSAH